MRPSWADHVPRRHLLPVRLPDGSPARRSAVAVLTATALLGVGTWTTATTAARALATQPVTVLGLTADGTCDPHTAERQHAAATDTRTQARALLTDLTLSADPADHALAAQITELGFRPATQTEPWRQHAVDVADHLHHLTTTHPHSAHPHSADPHSADPQLSEVGVRLAAAGLGPTPADLIDPPPAADLINDTAAGADAALGAVDQARAAATTPPPAATPPAATPPVQRSPAATPPVPAACTDRHRPATPAAPPEQPPAEDKTAPAPGPADAPADATSAAAATTVAAAAGPRTSTPPELPVPSVSVNNVDTDTQTGPERVAVAADDEKARAAIGMITDLLSAITAAGDRRGDPDATQVGATVLDALDRDRLAALGADPDDLDTLDHLRAATAGSGQPTTADTGSTPAPAAEQTSPSETDARPGATITRTQPTQPSHTNTTASGDESRADQSTSTSATPETPTSRPGSVAAGIEKLKAQARAAAEVDPLAQDLLDALDRTTSTGVEDRTVSGGERSGRPTSDNDPNTDSDSADLTGGAGDRAGHQPDTPRPATLTSGSAAKKPATGSGAEPPPATGDAETGPATDSTFDNLAQCESGGDWASDTGNGYHGGLQFSPATWRAFGGHGAAHEASRAEQIEVAKRVQAVQGWAAWPTCSQRLGLR